MGNFIVNRVFRFKNRKKNRNVSFHEKNKYIKAQVPAKIKLYIDNVLKKELEYFEKKYKYSIEIIANSELVIPEYIITLLNKNKKAFSKIENVNKLNELEKSVINDKSKNQKLDVQKKIKGKQSLDKKEIIRGKKKNRPLKTLWIRKKKKKAA